MTNDKKPTSKEAEYILKEFKKRFPDGTDYELAKGSNINRGTLHNMFYKSKTGFSTAHLLMRIAGYLGISMESILLCKSTEYDKDKEINYWKEKYFKAENEIKKLTEKEVAKRKAIKELLQ